MTPFGFSLLADENIHPDVIAYLRQQGFNVVTVWDEQLNAQPDIAIIRRAYEIEAVILTHDSDFGTIAVTQGEPLVGIIFLRPGHIRSAFTVATIKAIIQQKIEVIPPFILVAERQQNSVKIRVRQV